MKRTAQTAFNSNDSFDVDDPDNAVEVNIATDEVPAPSKSSTLISKAKKKERKSVKKVVAKVKRNKLTLHCRWINCSFSIANNVAKFVDHVGTHISHLEVTVDEEHDNTPCFRCLWGQCQSLLYTTLEAQLHVYYHGVYQEAIEFGAAIMATENFPKCKREGLFRDCIPEDFDLSNKPKCLWNSCTQPEFVNPYKFYQHMLVHVSNTNYKMDRCDWEYCKKENRCQSERRRHVASHTMEKYIACPNCFISYCTVTKFFDHCIRQMEDKPFECGVCGKKYASERILNVHMRNHKQSSRCPYCDLHFIRLADHIQHVHLPDNPYQCELCEFSTKYKRSLKHHLYTHFSDVIYGCDAEGCDYKCRSASTLKYHHALKHGDGFIPTYNCDVCSKKYRRRLALKDHYARVHDIQLPEKINYIKEDGCFHVDVPKDLINLAKKQQQPDTETKSDESSGSPDFLAYDHVDEEGNLASKVLVGTQPMPYAPQMLTIPNDPTVEPTQQQMPTLKPIPITSDFPPMFIFQSSLDSLRAENKDAAAFRIITQKPSENEHQ